MPMCSAFPGPLSVLVMDNARIHHGEGILELVDRFRLYHTFHFFNHIAENPSFCNRDKG